MNAHQRYKFMSCVDDYAEDNNIMVMLAALEN